MGNLFVMYGDVLSEDILSLSDLLVVPAYSGLLEARDELTQRIGVTIGDKKLQQVFSEEAVEEPLRTQGYGMINGLDLIDNIFFVNCLDNLIWNLQTNPKTEQRLVMSYHNVLTAAYVMGYKSIIMPYFGMSLSDSENEYMIKRIIRMLRKELSERRRGMDIYFVIPERMS